MMVFKKLSIVSAFAISSIATFAASTVTDITSEVVPLMNDKRTKELGDNALETLSTDNAAATELQTVMTTLDGAECDITDLTPPTGYSRSIVELGDDDSSSFVVDTIFAEINNYDCVYPPTSTSLKGEVSNFTYMMAETSTGVACKKTSACTDNPNVAICYFSAEFDGDEGTPFTDSAVFDAIATREDICSGNYFAQYSGIFLSLAALSVGSGYVLA